MDRFVMRHNELGGPALIPTSSLDHHRGQGWLRVSPPIAETAMDQVRLADYLDAPDLDAPPEPQPDAAQPAASKEK